MSVCQIVRFSLTQFIHFQFELYLFRGWVCSGLVVSLLDCQLRGQGYKSPPEQIYVSRFLLHLRPLANSAMTSTPTVHCQWEDEMARERTGHLPLYAKALAKEIACSSQP